jgi:hypothetical protein
MATMSSQVIEMHGYVIQQSEMLFANHRKFGAHIEVNNSLRGRHDDDESARALAHQTLVALTERRSDSQ